MPDEKKHETVKVGSLTCTLYQCKDGAWRWHYFDGGRRRTASARDISTAKRKAKGHLEALRAGIPHTRLPRAEVEAFFAWKKSRENSATIEDAAEQYLSSRSGVSDIYMRGLRSDVEKFVKANQQVRIVDIMPAHVAAFLDSMKTGPRRKNNTRAALRSWFRWCRSRQLRPVHCWCQC